MAKIEILNNLLFYTKSIKINLEVFNHKKIEKQYMNEFHKKSSEASQKAVEEMGKNPLSIEQMREQMRQGKEVAAKMYAADTPRVKEYVKNIKTPINFNDVLEMYNGLLRNQITFDDIPNDALEEFKLTRQCRTVLKKKKLNK